MNRNVYILLVAQFLTAFADNAILFTAIAMVIHKSASAPWYIPALQASFLVAFVVLAPWVGPFADKRPKTTALAIANLVKAAGAGLMLFRLDPLLAYAVVGIGAAMYSPAKYGILPELVDHDHLVKTNGWVEGSTILAILGGSLAGAAVADKSIGWALGLVILLYGVSAISALFITKTPPRAQESIPALPNFIHMGRELLTTYRARFALLGSSLFWAAGAVLRLMLVAWAPVALLTKDTTDIAALTLFIALGIAAGALLAPRLIPMEHLRRARIAAYLMSFCVIALSFSNTLWTARLALFAIGLSGGLFVVPINAALQEIGFKSIGSGRAVAIQHFSENVAMLSATGLYTLLAMQHVDPSQTIAGLGVLLVTVTYLVSRHIPAYYSAPLPDSKRESEKP